MFVSTAKIKEIVKFETVDPTHLWWYGRRPISACISCCSGIYRVTQPGYLMPTTCPGHGNIGVVYSYCTVLCRCTLSILVHVGLILMQLNFYCSIKLATLLSSCWNLLVLLWFLSHCTVQFIWASLTSLTLEKTAAADWAGLGYPLWPLSSRSGQVNMGQSTRVKNLYNCASEYQGWVLTTFSWLVLQCSLDAEMSIRWSLLLISQLLIRMGCSELVMPTCLIVIISIVLLHQMFLVT